MGKFNQGILGGFTGKVGGVVGARSRGQWIYRAYQGVVKNPKTIAQTKQREQFKIFSQEVTKVCKADMFKFNAAFPNAMTEHSFIVSICFNMLRAYQTYPKKPFETMKNVGLTKGIVNIGGIIDFAPIPSEGTPITGPAFGSKEDATASSGNKFYGLNFGGDKQYYSDVMANQGLEGLQSRFIAMWLTKGADGFYHVVIARQGDMSGITTSATALEKTGIAKCNFVKLASETEGWAWVNGTVGTGEDWTILYSGAGATFTLANVDENGNTITQVPIYYNWFTNSGKVPIGSICKLISTGVVTPGS